MLNKLHNYVIFIIVKGVVSITICNKVNNLDYNLALF